MELPFEIVPSKVIEVVAPEEPGREAATEAERSYSLLDMMRVAREGRREFITRVLTLTGGPAPPDLMASVHFYPGAQVLVSLSESTSSCFIVPFFAATLQRCSNGKVAIMSFRSSLRFLGKMVSCIYRIIADRETRRRDSPRDG
ncbi:hypothetical protein [Pyrodictium abyssi]|uniref:Uncharacterized protein n=1 Tax=Pyrodictium abyssi TaxID=54256 RepID=A0ABM8ITN6_9CREN|nr:hypothetical protein PABY_04810 [Pyrodictium abyssi]